MRGKLDSQYLEAFLTSDQGFSARIPFSPPIKINPSKFIIFISSNGFEATKDLTNRASIIRVKKREGHQFRNHNGKDALEMMFELQQVWYGAVVTVINAWHEQGKKRTNDTRHDFREWCQIMDWIVQNIFHAVPLMDDHAEAKDRASNPNLTFLRALAIAVNEDHQLNQSITATQLVNLCIEKEIEIPGLSKDSQTDVDAGKRQLGTVMGRLFGESTELTGEDFRVVKREENVANNHGNVQSMKRYTFSLVQRPAPSATQTVQS